MTWGAAQALTAEEEAEYREHAVDGSGAFYDRTDIARLLATLDAARAAARGEGPAEPADGLRTLDELQAALAEALDTHPDEVADETALLIKALASRGLTLDPERREDGWEELRREIEALPKWDKRTVPGGFHVNRAAVLAIVDRLATKVDE